MSTRIAIIPLPTRIEERSGSVTLTPDAVIAWQGTGAEDAAQLLAEYLRPATGFALPVSTLSAAPTAALQCVATGTARPDDAGFVNEAYTIDSANAVVRLEAENGTGLARAVQTLRQLLPAAVFSATRQNADWTIPAVRIADEPRFRWRGLHMDVCRHFFSVAEVKRFIDLLALHRLNTLHLHLTEDQGWRVEIKRYPKLTTIGSKRPCSLIGHESARPRRYDNVPHSGFFTQADIRELVAFAARRHVTIVPEIDMPGHMQAAIAAYPELGNTGAALEPRCHWGISHSILNAEESTVRFMCNVLDEIMELFPSRFIHIGGDEAPKLEWAESRRAQDLMIERGLTDEHELQSWFIRQLDAHIASRGRRLIGWDEILEGGLADGAAVMSWRGMDGGISAASAGHDVVMAPGEWTYYDHYQDEPKSEEPLCIGGMTTVAKVYSYEPIPVKLAPQFHHHVLGSQGQHWSEYIPDMARLEYMAYPRVCALSEVLWTPAGQRNYTQFLPRLAAHRERLRAMGVNAHPRP